MIASLASVEKIFCFLSPPCEVILWSFQCNLTLSRGYFNFFQFANDTFSILGTFSKLTSQICLCSSPRINWKSKSSKYLCGRGHKKLHMCGDVKKHAVLQKIFFFFLRDRWKCLLAPALCFKSVYSAECDVIDLCKNKFAETLRGSLLSEHFISQK